MCCVMCERGLLTEASLILNENNRLGMSRLFSFKTFGNTLSDVLLHHLFDVGHHLGLLERNAVEGFV